jgi:hypothetical protein
VSVIRFRRGETIKALDLRIFPRGGHSRNGIVCTCSDRPGGPVKPIDLGVLAECLVFYGTVRVIVDQVTFPFLVRSCGAEELLDLMNAGSLELEYIENLTGVIAKQIGNRTIYDYVRTLPNNSMSYMVVARKLSMTLPSQMAKGPIGDLIVSLNSSSAPTTPMTWVWRRVLIGPTRTIRPKQPKRCCRSNLHITNSRKAWNSEAALTARAWS